MDIQPTSSTPTNTPPVAPSAPPMSVTTGRGTSVWKAWLSRIGMVIVLLLLMAAAAYGGYYYEQRQAAATESDLRSQIQQLKRDQTSGQAKNGAAINSSDPACTDADLALAKVASNGSAGTVGITYSFTNKSDAACTLTQSPTVALVDNKGKQLGDAATPASVSDTTLTLQPNDVAYATVLFPEAGNFDAGKCSAAASMIDFVPSDGSAALTTAITGQSNCPGFSVQPYTSTAP